MIRGESAKVEQLAEILVLKDLQPSDLIALQPYATIHSYSKREVVVFEGDRLQIRLYILLQGSLQLTRIGTAGKETILRTLSPNEIFAAPALVGDAIAPATITAIQDSQILTIEREALLHQIRNVPEVALKILEVYNHRLQQMHQTLHDLISERAVVRLARLLLDRAVQVGTIPASQGKQLNLKLPHQQIAGSIGITYEECVRLFSQLKESISYQRGGKITILNWDMLTDIANGINIHRSTSALSLPYKHQPMPVRDHLSTHHPDT